MLDVISFLYVSLGSSTVQLQVAGAHALVQRLISVVKMATVLEDCTTEEEQHSLVHFRRQNDSAKNIKKEMFSVYGWKCL
jgi:hypothetical protein